MNPAPLSAAWLLNRGVRLLQSLVGFAAVIGAWHAASVIAANPPLVPPLSAIGRQLTTMASGDLLQDIGASLVHLGLGFGAGATLGLGLALLAARSVWFAAILDP